MFAPLHTKSEHSLGLGTAPVEALLRRAAEYGYPALALTDCETLSGQVRFHHAAQALGIKPITGVELRAGYGPREPGTKAGRLVLLARDRAGYESLCRIITHRRQSVTAATEDPLRCLDAAPCGLFYLSDDPAVIGGLLRAGVAADAVRFLWNPEGSLLREQEVRAVADPDVVMLDPADHPLHVLLAAIRQRQAISAVEQLESAERVLPAPAELRRRFTGYPEALEETLRVAEACSFDLTSQPLALPALELPESAESVLSRRCKQALAGARPEYQERLEHELGVLGELGFAGYFLIVAEIADAARRMGIALAGRGSAAGSLVAYALGLSTIDPVRYGLLFERFVHSGRRELPDIDLDLPSDRRDEIIDWVFRRFGEGRVAMVSAQQTFGRRAAYREGLKALGLSLGEVNRFCAQIPEDPDEERSAKSPLELLPERYRAAAPLLERLIGRPQHLSVHPGGVVLAEPRVECYAPLQRAPKGVPVTQYDMTSLERLGLIKLDLLGNRALSAIQEALRWIAVREPGSRAAREPGIPLPDGDPTTLDLLHAGNTVGCFQIETPALRSLLRKVPVRGVDDLIATLALVRPGPASGEAKAAYIRRAHGQEPPEPPHPALTGLLRPSYGILLYEEDLMAAIARLTGCSLSRADQIRAELIRSEPGSAERAELEGGFVAAALAAGVSRTEATEVWQILERFAAYSFSKAHAASYAQLAWQAAYLKAHFPLELACGVLNSYGGQYPLRTVAAEFARSGVRLLGPHVNHSESRHSVQAGAVRLGLESVKYLTALSRERIRSSRPFADLAELLGKVPLQARELEALVLGGACDDLEPLRTAGYPFAHEDFLSQWQQNPDLRALSGWQFRRPAGEHAAIHAALVRIRNELRFLGMHPSAHPMRVLRNEAARAGCITTAELASHAGREVHLAGLVAATRRLPVSGGRTLQFVTLEDEHGLVEAVRRPGGSAVPGDPITNPGPFLLSGRVETDHGDRQLVISKVTPFHLRTSPYGAPATV